MRQVTYVDEIGRKWAMLVPDNAPDSAAHLGMTLGPVDLDPLGLPRAYAVRLHNALFDRAIFTSQQARKHPHDIASAIKEAMRPDVAAIIALYDSASGDILATTPEDAPRGD